MLGRGIDVLLLRLVLLQDVVLDRAGQIGLGDATLLADGDVHRQERGGGSVDRHRCGDRAEVDVGVEVLHVAQGVDGDTGAADLTERPRRVGVVAHEGGHVEGGGETHAAVAEDLLEAGVGVLGRAEAGEHPHRPETRAVAGGVQASGERVLPRRGASP